MSQPAETPKPTETANGAAPPPAAEPDKRAKLAEVAAREKQKLAARQREAVERQQLAHQAAQERAQREALERQIAEYKAQLEMDPLDLLEKRGVTAKQIGERILKRGTPEEAVQQAIERAKAAEEKAEAIQKEMREREARAQREASVLSARRQLQDTFAGIKDQTPVLARLARSPEALEREYLTAWQRIQQDPQARAQQFTDAEILVAWEAVRRAELEEAIEGLDEATLDAHLTKRRGSASLTEKPAEAGASGRPETKPAKVTAQKTLTNSMATGSSFVELSDDEFNKLSDKEQNKYLGQLLKHKRART